MSRDAKLSKVALALQRGELTEALVYEKLAKRVKDAGNAQVLRRIAEDERRHAAFWQGKSGKEASPRRMRVAITVAIAVVFGLSFALKRMERREGTGSRFYGNYASSFPDAVGLGKDEAAHERAILSMLNEERLQYVGSIVLGLNDALVELTGSLAGFTLALADPKLISLAGLVTGISAAFSMAASDYLSSKAEGNPKASTSALYTGASYLVTVVILISPFLLLSSIFLSLALTLGAAVLIILGFNYYLAVAKDLDFKRRFLEMAGISLGVATFSFFVGWALKALLGIET